MKITDLENKKIKIGKTSITALDDDYKTCGVVRNIQPYKTASNRVQFEHFKTICNAGIWGNKDFDMTHVIISDNKVYYLHNTRPYDFMTETLKKHPEDEEATGYIKRIDEAIKTAEQYVTVIRVNG